MSLKVDCMKLKDFGWTYNVHRFALNEQSVAQLREKAAADDHEACYMYGRYHYCVRPEPNSVSQALELYKKALSGGVADANVAIAIMWSEGDMGIADLERYNDIIDDMMERGCDFAFLRRLLDMIVGKNGIDKDAEKAAEIIEMLFEERDEDNALWYYLMGRALMECQNNEAAATWFEKAVAAGFLDANCYLVLTKCLDADCNLKVDENHYMELLNDAYAKGDGLAAYMLASLLVDRFDEVEDSLRAEFRDHLLRTAIYGYRAGYGCAATLIGDICINGSCDLEYDLSEAWMWYAKGALFGDAEAFEKLYKMATSDLHPMEDELFEQLAIDGARQGSETLKAEVVKLYRNGRLQHYAKEIEALYMA